MRCSPLPAGARLAPLASLAFLAFLALLPATLLACNQHNTGAVEVVADDCATCHETEAAAVVEPPHVGNFPPTCFECHSTAAWKPAQFSHDNVVSSCLACHRSDYEGTTNPPHVQDGYPQTCNDCHTTNMWIPALDGLHPEAQFPTNTGPHEPFECLDCHDASLGPSQDGANTDCVGCHTGEHARQRVDEQHQEEPDYVFDPNNPHFCLECHPRGLKE
jgi:hypothetical protein